MSRPDPLPADWLASLESLPADADPTWTLPRQDNTAPTIPLGEILGRDVEPSQITRWASGPGKPPQPFIATGTLGSGGFGEILLAVQPELNREVAVKVLHIEHLADERQRQRFIDEARITAGLEHPGVVPVHAAGDDYLMMKRVHGHTLGQLLELQRLDTVQAVDVLIKVAETIAFAHARGIIHRDLKPSNIMVGSFGEVLVMDWGLAAPLTDGPNGERHLAPGHGACAGTPAYLAPESANGLEQLVGTATDVFGLGALLYEVLSGQPPYQGPNLRAILERASEGARSQLLVNDNAPADLIDICTICMQIDPAVRGSVQQLIDQLDQWRSDNLRDQQAQALAEAAQLRIDQPDKDHAAIESALHDIERARGLISDPERIDHHHAHIYHSAVDWLIAHSDLDLAASIAVDRPQDTGLQEHLEAHRQERSRALRLAQRRRRLIRASVGLTVVLLFSGASFWWYERTAEHTRRHATAVALLEEAFELDAEPEHALALLGEARGLAPHNPAINEARHQVLQQLFDQAVQRFDRPAATAYASQLEQVERLSLAQKHTIRAHLEHVITAPDRLRRQRRQRLMDLADAPPIDDADRQSQVVGELTAWWSHDLPPTAATHSDLLDLLAQDRADLHAIAIRVLGRIRRSGDEHRLLAYCLDRERSLTSRRLAAQALIDWRPPETFMSLLDGLRQDPDLRYLSRQLMTWERDEGILMARWQRWQDLDASTLVPADRHDLQRLADRCYAVGRKDEFLAISRLLGDTSLEHLRRRILCIPVLSSQPARDHRRDYARELLAHGPDPLAYDALARYELSNGERTTGLAIAEQGLVALGEAHHDLLPTWFGALTWTGDAERIRAGFERLLSAIQNNRITLPFCLCRGLLFVARFGHAGRVLPTLTGFARERPDDLDVQLALLQALISNERWQEAILFSHRLSDRWPNRPQIYLFRSKAWQALDDLPRAHLAVRLAIARQPRLGDVLIRHGHVLRALGEHERALARFRKAEEMLPTNRNAVLPGLWTACYTGHDGDALYFIQRYHVNYAQDPAMQIRAGRLHLAAARVHDCLELIDHTEDEAAAAAILRALLWCISSIRRSPDLPDDWKDDFRHRTHRQIYLHLSTTHGAEPAHAMRLIEELPEDDIALPILTTLATGHAANLAESLNELPADFRSSWCLTVQEHLKAMADNDDIDLLPLPAIRDNHGCPLPAYPSWTPDAALAEDLRDACQRLMPTVDIPRLPVVDQMPPDQPARFIDADWQWPPTAFRDWLERQTDLHPTKEP